LYIATYSAFAPTHPSKIMDPLLPERNNLLTERMDDPACDRELLFNTYRQFSKINRLLSGWKQIYRSRIKPEILRNGGKASILDIGCGGGDIILHLCELCSKDSFDVQFTGIDPNERAHQFLSEVQVPENVRFMQTSSQNLADENLKFDIVISNHLIHHLSAEQLDQICRDVRILAKKRVIFNDIERNPIGYAVFKTIAPFLFKNSFIVEDGLTSIRRSYKKKELEQGLPNGWQVNRQIPFRLLAEFKTEPK